MYVYLHYVTGIHAWLELELLQLLGFSYSSDDALMKHIRFIDCGVDLHANVGNTVYRYSPSPIRSCNP